MNIMNVFKRKPIVDVIDPDVTTWRHIATIDLCKPWNRVNERLVLCMDVLDKASKNGHVQWRMNRDGDLASFEAFCNEAEWKKIQDIFEACD